jgi:hypothetical protein
MDIDPRDLAHNDEIASGEKEKNIILNLGQGITVTVKNVKNVSIDILDEIATAIVAIKMYLKSKKRISRPKLRSRTRNISTNINGENNNKSSTLWIKTWLREVMNDFDFNPYRQAKTLDMFHRTYY